MNINEVFREIIHAIKNNKPNRLGELLNYARSNNFSQLPVMQDTEGNTILHHLLLQGELELMRASLAYESGFHESYTIKNQEGKMPYMCLENLPQSKSSFIKKALSILGPSASQNYILAQFMAYLRIKHKKNPDEYREEDFVPILNSLKQGHCAGLSSLWLQCWLDGNEEKYKEIFNNIVHWDNSEEKLTPVLEKEFENAFQLTRGYQLARDYLAWEISQMEEQYERWLQGAPSKIQKKLFKALPQLRFQTRETGWEKVWDPEKYQNEFTTEGQKISLEELKLYIKKFAVPANDGKGMGYSANNHAIASAYKEGKFTIFDSNYHESLENGFVTTKSFDINKDDELESAAHEIRYRLYDNLGKKDLKEIDISIRFYDKKSNEPGVYFDFLAIQALKFFDDAEKEQWNNVDPFHFAMHYEQLTRICTGDQMKAICKKVTFDELEVNKIFNRNMWSAETPLMILINAGDFPEAIEALLRNKADPQLESDGITALSNAEIYERNESLKILQKFVATSHCKVEANKPLHKSESFESIKNNNLLFSGAVQPEKNRAEPTQESSNESQRKKIT